MSDGIPRGFIMEEVRAGKRYYRGPGKIVITGDVPDEDHLPEHERHNCDEMGCGWEHVIQIIRVFMPYVPDYMI
jgi:hypothetical protein